MTLLFDYPWTLDVTFAANSQGFKALEVFRKVTKEGQLDVIPFVDAGEFSSSVTKAFKDVADKRAAAEWLRFAKTLVRYSSYNETASPQGPQDLSQSWRKALRESIDSDRDWRRPQIVVTSVRRGHWPAGDSVQIELDGTVGPKMESRALVTAESYDLHPYASCDLDPWNVSLGLSADKCARPQPRCLPKLPTLRGLPTHTLADALPAAWQQGWEMRDIRYYPPPRDWTIESSSRARWRKAVPSQRIH